LRYDKSAVEIADYLFGDKVRAAAASYAHQVGAMRQAK
jgi:hypothetical protein